MKQLQPVVWSKGIFLQPQHLQLQDRYFESVIHFRHQVLGFAPYGFAKLKLDHEALGSGQLGILEAAGLTSDGLAFDFPTSEAPPSPKALSAAFEPVRGDTPKSADFHLAIPSYQVGGANLSKREPFIDARYVAHSQLVRDENSGTAEKSVQVARKNFRILAEHEVREGLTTIRLARVVRDDAGRYHLDRDMVPPFLSVESSATLRNVIKRLVELISARSTVLSGLRREKDLVRADWTAADIESFWLLYTLNGVLPILRQFCDSPADDEIGDFRQTHHPEEVFAEMLSLAGALTAFSQRAQVRDLPGYNHEDLGSCFSSLAKAIVQLLDQPAKMRFVSLPLAEVRDLVFASAIDDEKYLIKTHFYLAVSSRGLKKKELVKYVLEGVKMCSATHISHLLDHALPGIRLAHVAPPPSIPAKLEYEYFALEQEGAYWESVLRARNIAAFLPSSIRNPKAEVIITFS
jgi:type VI secretion system protein ImpJ